MQTYVVLLRGVNVGGKNTIAMSELRGCLTELGFENVATYINSGNVLLDSKLSPTQIKKQIETALIENFKFDSQLIKVLVLTLSQLRCVIDNKPAGFGEQPGKYHSDVIFLIDCEIDQALSVFNPREGVDTIWPGEQVIYSQRLSAKRTKSRLSKIVGTSVYRSMTIRTWSTTVKLCTLLEERKPIK